MIEFPADYRYQLSQTVATFLHYPPIAQRDRQQGTTLVCVLMTRGGRITDEKLGKATGYDALDREALDVFRRIGSMPHVPEQVFPGITTISFAFPVDYKLGP